MEDEYFQENIEYLPSIRFPYLWINSFAQVVLTTSMLSFIHPFRQKSSVGLHPSSIYPRNSSSILPIVGVHVTFERHSVDLTNCSTNIADPRSIINCDWAKMM